MQQRSRRRNGVLVLWACVAALVLALDTAAGGATTTAAGPTSASPPQNTRPPAIAGNAREGGLLRADTGRWRAGTVRHVVFRFQWSVCDVTGAGCVPVAKSTDSVYAVRHGDVGRTLAVTVTAVTSGGASASVSSSATGVVTPARPGAPTTTDLPVIGGKAVAGAALTAQSGAWTGDEPIRVGYRWRSCLVSGGHCRDLGSKDATVVLGRRDVGHVLRVLVIARNPAGTSVSLSDPTAPVVAAAGTAAPRATRGPAVSGTPRAGHTLTATSGSWTGAAPISFAYRWVLCGRDGGARDGSNCAPIAGATGPGYRLTGSDVGWRLRVRVTATNDAGSATAASEPTSVVGPAGPAVPVTPHNTREPSLAGAAAQGQTLTADPGSWTGAGTIKLSYQWVRCGPDGGLSDGSNCADIRGATATKYAVAAGDVGSRLRFRVTARSPFGQQTAASNATPPVKPLASGPPRALNEPAIAGALTQGQTLTATGGSWAGATPITLAYQWVRCGTDGGRPDGSNCAAIPNGSAPRYVPVAADVGARLRVRVTARNAKGVSTVASNATLRITAASPELPPGAVRLPNGKYSIPVTSVSLPARLIIDGVRFNPDPVRTRRTQLQLRVHVVDTRGYIVRDALVFGRSTPLVTTPAGEPRSAMDGWATLRMVPKASFPIRRGHSVQFFVRVRKPGDSLLAGVSTRRLVQVRTAS